MKADTGRILRQRFCFLMAMVSCRNGDKGWARAASLQDPHMKPLIPHKAVSLEPPLPPLCPCVAEALGSG